MEQAFEYKQIDLGGQVFEMAGLPSDIYFRGLSSAGSANQLLCDIIWNDMGPESTILDVGANIGLTTMLFNKVPQRATVYSFEPGKKAFSCLSETLRRNGLSPDRAFNFGLGDVPGRLPFFEAEMLAGSQFVTGEHSLSSLANNSIEVRTIDDFVREQAIDKVDFIKIDVEGFEAEVLRGAERTLSLMKPRVFVEFNSYTLIAVRNVNPRQFLDDLLSRFSTVSTFTSGRWAPIRTASDRHDFMYANLVQQGCVSDLLCQ